MPPPRPTALRLFARARDVRAPKPLLGLGGWSADASAIAVLLGATGVDIADPAAVAAQVPPASELCAGTSAFVLGAPVRDRGILRCAWSRMRPVPPATRGTPRA